MPICLAATEWERRRCLLRRRQSAQVQVRAEDHRQGELSRQTGADQERGVAAAPTATRQHRPADRRLRYARPTLHGHVTRHRAFTS